jgi:translation initiation factor IF-2
MSKVRVYEVARELGMKNKELVALFQSMGFSEVRNHMSSIDSDLVDRVKRKLERRSEPEIVEERIQPTVIKRRAKASDRRREAAEAAPAPASEPVRRRVPAGPASAPAAPVRKRRAEPPPPPSAPAPLEAAPKAPEPRQDESPPEAPSPPSDRAPVVEATAAAPAPEPAPLSAPAPSAPAPPAPEPFKPAPPPPPSKRAAQAAPPKPPPAPPAAASTEEVQRRRTQPPKSGIEVWEGRPGVPMPQRPRTTGPQARRTTYDPRANVGGGRPGYGYGRPVAGRPMRPPFPRGRAGFQKQRRGPVEVSTKEMSEHKKVIKMEGETSLQVLAGKMSLKATEVLMKLLGMGMTGVNINSTLDADTAKLLAGEFGWTVEDVSVDMEEQLEEAMQLDEVQEGEALGRPPIVTVMGHVDHGKTSLLDKIRRSQVAAGEAGGITQHIGAYRVETKRGTICFLDTPGHEAFTAMRARGAGVTDIVILVVAADDGVMPQTREAISHSRDAGVPMIVAINKMDKPGVDPERVMRDLGTEGLQPEDWGGDTICARVSAKSGEGIDNLLELVLLQAELLELKAYPQRRASGVVVEALLDRGRGAVARVLVQDGTMHRGDYLVAGQAQGKIRAMVDEKGRALKEAGPSTPVEVLGLDLVPDAGDPVHAVRDSDTAKTISEERRKRSTKPTSQGDVRMTLGDLARVLSEAEQLELKVIIKADVQGSVEALAQSLGKLSTPKVKLTVVHTGVGGITETDVNLAVAAKGIIIGFNVRPAGKARKHAEQEGIEIRLYSVIYEVIDDVRSAMEGLLPARRVEKELGKAEVRQVFRITKVGTIAGCMVTEGLIRRSADVRLVRDSVVVWEGKISSLKRFKDDAREVREGFECGIGLEGYNDLKEGDFVEAFEFDEVKETLS